MCKQCDADNKLAGATLARKKLRDILKRKPNWERTQLMEEFDRWYMEYERECKLPEDHGAWDSYYE